MYEMLDLLCVCGLCVRAVGWFIVFILVFVLRAVVIFFSAPSDSPYTVPHRHRLTLTTLPY